MQTRLRTVTATAPHAEVFNFLADIENLPVWTGGFCEWLELHQEGWLAYTAIGELNVETKVDDIARTVDLQYQLEADWVVVISLRVRADGGTGSVISAACRQPSGMLAGDYERLIEALLTGLSRLTSRPLARVVV